MKNFLAIFLLAFASFVNAQIVTVPIPGAPGLNVTVGTGVNALPLQDIRTNPNAVNVTMSDDAWQNVQLPYTFPYFGKNFTNSWMLSNGAVTFQDPTQNAWGMCCSGMDLTTLTDTRYNYTIFGVWTDLIAIEGGTHHYVHQGNSTTFGWYGVSQFYDSSKRNSFEIKIDSTGLVDTRISGALVTGNWVTSGMTGDLSKGEYYQYYHGNGINIPNGAGVSWSALGGTGSNICVTSPLSSPTCPGYAEAFFNQQCTISALYNPSCPGYAQAFFNQQCTVNSLYDQSCPGYAQAYFSQQCSLNPLYDTQCSGYAEAYFAQQCSLNGLYDIQCPNYAEAFATKQALENSNKPVTTQVTTTTTNTSQPVSLVSDPIVNQTITTTTTTTTPTNPAAAVNLTTPTTQQTTTQQVVQNTTTETTTKTETKTETKAETKSTSSSERQSAKTESKSDDKQKSAEIKQAVQEKAKEEMKKAETSSTFEGQVAVQTNVIGAMSFVPGFSVYAQAKVPDVLARDLQRQYGKDVVDNRRLGRGLFGPSDSRHQDMVNQQYR